MSVVNKTTSGNGVVGNESLSEYLSRIQSEVMSAISSALGKVGPSAAALSMAGGAGGVARRLAAVRLFDFLRRRLKAVFAAFCLISVCAVSYESFATENADDNFPWLHGDVVRQLPFAERGDPRAQYRVAWFYLHGAGGVKEDIEQGMRWLTLSAEQKYPKAMLMLAGKLFADENAENDDVALSMLNSLFARRDEDKEKTNNGKEELVSKKVAATAAYGIGLFYEKKKAETKIGKEKAVYWYSQSAEMGNGVAAYMLGDAYFSGKLGLKKNKRQAAHWWRQSAATGNAHGQYALGWAFNEGYGVDKNKEKARMWWRLSAAQGNEHAANSLAEIEEGN